MGPAAEKASPPYNLRYVWLISFVAAFAEAGYGVSSIMFNIVITGAVNLLFTLIAIQTVDRFGRRALMLVGCAGEGSCPGG